MRWRQGEPQSDLATFVRSGGVLGIPTESSYGLGVDPHNQEAVNRLVALKGRRAQAPFPVVVGATHQLGLCGIHVDPEVQKKLERLWPAPVTVVLELEAPIPASLGAGTLAVRVPDHPLLRSLLLDLNLPLTATSANLSGSEPILDPESVEHLLVGAQGLVVDGGRLPGGPPSTIVRWTQSGIIVLRWGRYPKEALEEWAGDLLQSQHEGRKEEGMA